MLKPGIILAPQTSRNVIGELPAEERLHWYVSGFHEKWDTAEIKNFSGHESDVLPLISDVLFILDPGFCRFEYLTFAIRNSCHLFLETTDNLTVAQLEQLIELAHEASTQIVVRADLLYEPLTRHLFQINHFPRIAKGEHTSTGLHGDLFAEITGFLRIILKLNPTEITEKAVAGGKFLSASTDFIDLHLSFADGMVTSLSCSNLATSDRSLLSIYRNGGLLEIDFLTNHLISQPENQTFSFPVANADELLLRQMNDFLLSLQKMEFSMHSLEEEKEVVVLINHLKEQLRINSISI